MVMNIWQSILLGILQGLTEFLPVSSSGHLVLAQHLLGVPEVGVAFDAFLHLATLLAVVVYFWGEVAGLIQHRAWRVAWLIVLGSLPAAVVGLAFENFFAGLFQRVEVVGVALLFTGFFLYLADRSLASRYSGARQERRSWEEMREADALMVGLAQAVAIVPGISRSGSTLAAGIFAGLEREFAARYSFLLSIPVVAGAGLLQLKDLAVTGVTEGWLPLGLGFLAAFLSGIWAIKTLLRLLTGGWLRVFAYYTWTVGALSLLWYFLV